jgi:hypothetical protein
MKTKPTLEDYLHAARNDSPALPFEEAARRVREADRRKRRGFWLWLRSSLATPLLGMNISGRAFWNGAFAGAVAAGLMFVFLTKTGNEEQQQPNLAQMNGARKNLAQNGVSRNNTEQAAQQQVPQRHTAQQQTVQQQAAIKGMATSAVPERSASGSASGNTPVNVHAHNSSPLLAVTTTTAPTVLHDSTDEARGSTQAQNANGEHHKGQTMLPTQAAPPLLAWVRRAEHTDSLQNTPLQNVSPQNTSMRNVVRMDTARSHPATPAITLIARDSSQAFSELAFMPFAAKSRFAIEYRMAARTGFDAAPGGTPLQNIALGVFYKLSEHHSVGIEGGTQPFALGYRASSPVTASLTTTSRTDTVRGLGITTTPSASSTLTTNATTQDKQAEAQSGVLPWVAAAYQYSHDVLDVVGIGLQPIARVSLGGGAAGGLGRCMVGVSVLPDGTFSILLAAEAAVLGRTTTDQTLANRFLLSSQAGVTMGVSVKF